MRNTVFSLRTGKMPFDVYQVKLMSKTQFSVFK